MAEENILAGQNDLEKGAYLGAIASIATADRVATEEELKYLTNLCSAASLSDQQTTAVLKSATDLSESELIRCLDILKLSQLKYSLVADLMAFGEADKDYSEIEKQNVQKIAQYLQINKEQFSLLDKFTSEVSKPENSSDEKGLSSVFSSLGLKEKMDKAGINSSSLVKNLLGIAGPVLLAKMVSSGLGRNRNMHSMNMRGGYGSGGIGSLISMLSGGRGMGSVGGLLSRFLR